MRYNTIELKSISHSYRSRRALSNVSLTIEDGVTGLLGINGAGKSTLLSILATLHSPSAGQVIFNGQQALTPKDLRRTRRRIGWMPQDLAVPMSATVSEFISYIAWLKAVPSRQRNRDVAEAISCVGLADRSRDRVGSLSGGMQRRMFIAQAIVNKPDILLLDEPTAGLDPDQRLSLHELIVELGDSSAVVIATHLLEDVAACVSRVVVLNEGTVKADQTIEQFAGDPNVTVERLANAFQRTVSGQSVSGTDSW